MKHGFDTHLDPFIVEQPLQKQETLHCCSRENWRNPLEYFVKVLVLLSAKAGSAGAAGSSSVSVGGINQRTLLLGGSRDWEKSVFPQLLHFSVEQLVHEQPLSF